MGLGYGHLVKFYKFWIRLVIKKENKTPIISRIGAISRRGPSQRVNILEFFIVLGFNFFE